MLIPFLTWVFKNTQVHNQCPNIERVFAEFDVVPQKRTLMTVLTSRV